MAACVLCGEFTTGFAVGQNFGMRNSGGEGVLVKKTKTEITIRTDEVVILRANRRESRISCRQCQGETLMITPEEAKALANTSAREIYRWVETGQIHYTERPDGSLLLCPDSILRIALKPGQSRSENPKSLLHKKGAWK